ncbi:MAG: phosphoribosylformimino-5-aminoimidazole carboxamide ribotide isomerase [Lachnospiraceae bacterium]|nr:phosphoribosylformimino-5-aminoimidazole carboxamide ribotide isomerase [Lachnospiraceae bacterium]
MKFRPCIDIHNGRVKQIVGGSLSDGKGNAVSSASENFVSEHDAAYFAELYRQKNLRGGHIILLNKAGTDEYEQTRRQAVSALGQWKGGMSVGGGITVENAESFLDAGAYAVIITSYVFRNGIIDMDRLEEVKQTVGREHVILDLSCRKKDDGYYVVTDRWQNFTDTKLDKALMKELEAYSCEYLIHAVDVEGKQSGIEKDVLGVLSEYAEEGDLPVTYAGGVHSYEDIELIKEGGRSRIDVTVGSALDIFGGKLSIDRIEEML